jgi:hypothetical protein
MPRTHISRDPFARETLTRETLHIDHRTGPTCEWCGNNPYDRLFRYYIEPDSVRDRSSPITGLFCCIGCMRSYHS